MLADLRSVDLIVVIFIVLNATRIHAGVVYPACKNIMIRILSIFVPVLIVIFLFVQVVLHRWGLVDLLKSISKVGIVFIFLQVFPYRYHFEILWVRNQTFAYELKQSTEGATQMQVGTVSQNDTDKRK